MAQEFGTPISPMEPPKQNNNQRIIIIVAVILVVLLLCCCCLVAGYFGLSAQMGSIFSDINSSLVAP